MNINEFQYLWTTEKDDHVLVDSEFGYGIIDQKTHMMLCISDEEIEEAVIKKMLEAGNRIYENINEALPDD